MYSKLHAHDADTVETGYPLKVVLALVQAFQDLVAEFVGLVLHFFICGKCISTRDVKETSARSKQTRRREGPPRFRDRMRVPASVGFLSFVELMQQRSSVPL